MKLTLSRRDSNQLATPLSHGRHTVKIVPGVDSEAEDGGKVQRRPSLADRESCITEKLPGELETPRNHRDRRLWTTVTPATSTIDTSVAGHLSTGKCVRVKFIANEDHKRGAQAIAEHLYTNRQIRAHTKAMELHKLK